MFIPYFSLNASLWYKMCVFSRSDDDICLILIQMIEPGAVSLNSVHRRKNNYELFYFCPIPLPQGSEL